MMQFFLDAKTQFHEGLCYFLQPSQWYLDLHYFCGILLIVFVVLEKRMLFEGEISYAANFYSCVPFLHKSLARLTVLLLSEYASNL